MSTSHDFMLSLNNSENCILFKFKRFLELQQDPLQPNHQIEKLNYGHCAAFSALWSFAKNLEFRIGHQSTTVTPLEIDSLTWYYKVVDTLAIWDGESLDSISIRDKIEIERFLSNLFFFQSPKDIIDVHQGNLAMLMQRDKFPIRLIKNTSNQSEKSLVLSGNEILIINNRPNFAVAMRVYNEKLQQYEYVEKELIRAFNVDGSIVYNSESLLLDKLCALSDDTFESKLLRVQDNTIYSLVSTIITNCKGNDLSRPIQEFIISGHITQESLEQVLPEIIGEGCMVLLHADKHRTSIFRKNETTYNYFDPNDLIARKLESDTIRMPDEDITAAEAAKRIFLAHSIISKKSLSITIDSYNWAAGTKIYHPTEDLLTRYFTVGDIYSIDNSLFLALINNDPRSFRYWVVNNLEQINRTFGPLGHSLLHLACSYYQYYQIELISFLLQNGADPNQLDGLFESSLHMACRKGQTEVVRLLLSSRNINIHCINPRTGNNALHNACLSRNKDIIKLLLDFAVQNHDMQRQCNVVNNRGLTPLVTATYLGDNDIVRMLLSGNGINDLTQINKAMDIALVAKNKEVIILLAWHGAKIDDDAVIVVKELFGSDFLARLQMINLTRSKKIKAADKRQYEAWAEKYRKSHPDAEKHGFGAGALVLRM